jgi:hypothetical protein
MSPRDAEPRERRCECGARLTWESRESPTGMRWLALCDAESCGAITTSQNARDEHEGGLQRFLLGDKPVRRELRPWTRFFFRASAMGYRWTPAPEPCPECLDESASALDLRWNTQRHADPFRLILCPRCGSTVLFYWIDREHVRTSLTAEAWFEPAPQIALLRRALHERAQLAAGYEPWSFE